MIERLVYVAVGFLVAVVVLRLLAGLVWKEPGKAETGPPGELLRFWRDLEGVDAV